jgi:immune inhibitor A
MYISLIKTTVLSFIVLLLFITGAIAQTENAQNKPIATYSHSKLLEFLNSSPSYTADILYLNGKTDPILIKDIQAMPLNPNTKRKLQAAGKLQELITNLNSLRAQHTLEGIPIDKSSRKLSALTNTFATITGTKKAIVLYVDFSDNTAKTNVTSFYNLLFGTGSSMRNFYQSVSYNKVFVEGTVSGWYRAPNTYAYYVNNKNGLGLTYPRNAQRLVEDTIDLANPYIDFSQYDSDHNGWVDCLFVVHAGPGAEFTGLSTDIWSHQWGINTKLVDGVYISDYSMEPEYWETPGDMTIGVFCHELGHVFGLPDFYDTDYTSEGLGDWSLMASGSWNGPGFLGAQPSYPDAWCKINLGWVQPIVPTVNILTAAIPACETTQIIYKLWTNGIVANQYFLVENRQRIGYDAFIPNSGLAIYHVDDSQTSNDNEWYPGHTNKGHYWVALEQADGLWQLEKNTSYGNAGDLWPGSSTKRVFDAGSVPDSKSYTSVSTKVAVKQISNSGAMMTADIYVTDPTPVDLSQFDAIVEKQVLIRSIKSQE